jgi:hypothetical protein
MTRLLYDYYKLVGGVAALLRVSASTCTMSHKRDSLTFESSPFDSRCIIHVQSLG